MRRQGPFKGVFEMRHEGHEKMESILAGGILESVQNFMPSIPQKARRAYNSGSFGTHGFWNTFRNFMPFMPYMPCRGVWGTWGTKKHNFFRVGMIIKSYENSCPSCPTSGGV